MSNKIYEISGYPGGFGAEEEWMKWYDLSQSYRRAVRILLNAEIPDRDAYSERDIMPILSAHKMYLELVFKALLVKEKQKIPSNHDIMQLLRLVQKNHPPLKFSKESLTFIKFLHNLDPKGYAFRYPVDKKLSEFFPSQPKETEIIITLDVVSIGVSKVSCDIDKYISKVFLNSRAKISSTQE